LSMRTGCTAWCTTGLSSSPAGRRRIIWAAASHRWHPLDGRPAPAGTHVLRYAEYRRL
jgi:hypothetical protein